MVLGLIGGGIGLFAGVFVIVVRRLGEAYGAPVQDNIMAHGIAAIVIALIGLVAASSVKSIPRLWGWVLNLCAVGTIVAIATFGLLPAIFYLIAGTMAIFRR